MPSIPFGTSSYERARGDLPALPVINGWIEEAPTEEKGTVLQSRPGLADREEDMGDGPVRGLFKADNVLGTQLFGVSGGLLYQGTTDIGSIDGSGPVSMAGYENFLFVAAGASLWGFDGVSLAAITFPDSADVAKVIVAQSRAIVIRQDTGKFYWSDALEEDIESLDFATAEVSPDRLRDMLFVDGILVLFGAETTEFWPATQDDDLPFSPLQARVIERGIKSTGCAAPYASSFVWVTERNQVCLGDEKTVISNTGLEERIAASTTCSLFRFYIFGVEFIGLRLDSEFQAWTARSGRWSEFQSYGQTNFIPQCYAGDRFGSSIDGRILEWGTLWTDLGGVLERRVRAGYPINSGGLPISNLQARCNIGHTPYLTGDYADPSVEMRLSRDAGQTWGIWRRKSLGEQGNYRQQVRWNSLGMASQPAFLAELRVTDPVDWRLSDVLINEGYGGR